MKSVTDAMLNQMAGDLFWVKGVPEDGNGRFAVTSALLLSSQRQIGCRGLGIHCLSRNPTWRI
jgi:hypothetical protein